LRESAEVGNETTSNYTFLQVKYYLVANLLKDRY